MQPAKTQTAAKRARSESPAHGADRRSSASGSSSSSSSGGSSSSRSSSSSPESSSASADDKAKKRDKNKNKHKGSKDKRKYRKKESSKRERADEKEPAKPKREKRGPRMSRQLVVALMEARIALDAKFLTAGEGNDDTINSLFDTVRAEVVKTLPGTNVPSSTQLYKKWKSIEAAARVRIVRVVHYATILAEFAHFFCIRHPRIGRGRVISMR